MKRFYSLFILLVGVLSTLLAHDAVVNGIYYNLDATNKTEPEELAFFVAGNGGSDATGVWCNGIEWNGSAAQNQMTDADKDGIYEITFSQVPAGTWNFKVVGVTEGNMSWMGSDYLDTENSSTGFTTAPYDGNIGFTLIASADITIKFNTATGKIILTTPSGSFGKVIIDYFSVANTDECLLENRFTAANNNTLTFTENIIVNPESGCGYAYYRILGNCNYAVYEKSFGVDVTESGIYTVTIKFNGDYDNPEFTINAVKQESTTEPDTPLGPSIPAEPDTPVNPEPEPEPELNFFVAGNGGSDATGVWCNGIEWSSSAEANRMKDADKDGIFEITYTSVPAGTWNFKVVGVTEGNISWMGSNFLDTTNSSAGYTTAPYDGNIGFTLTQAANVTIKFNTATGKIILTTPSGNFGKVKIDYFSVANTDECLLENTFTAANNNTLKYTVDIQVSEESGLGYAGFRILGNCNYAVYENSLVVEVSESGKYEVTIVFNGDYDNPEFTINAVKQGSTTEPDTPDDDTTMSVEEVNAVVIYAKEGTIYSEVDFEIYSLAGVNVTMLNGSLQGVYIVKTAEGNRLVSVW